MHCFCQTGPFQQITQAEDFATGSPAPFNATTMALCFPWANAARKSKLRNKASAAFNVVHSKVNRRVDVRLGVESLSGEHCELAFQSILCQGGVAAMPMGWFPQWCMRPCGCEHSMCTVPQSPSQLELCRPNLSLRRALISLRLSPLAPIKT